MTPNDVGRRNGPSATSIGALLLLTGVGAGVALAAFGGDDTPLLSLLALLLAGSLLVHIPVLWGGSVPVGYALLIALPSLTPLGQSLVVITCGLMVVAGVTIARAGSRAAIAPIARFGLCALAAVVGSEIVQSFTSGDGAALAEAIGAAGLLILVELAVTRHVRVDGATIDIRSALPVLLTVTCGAALITVARAEVGWEMTVVAAFPLLITRFSFRRSAEAEETLRQTVQALGLVPELAGLAPLGRSERTAVYARRMARNLGCSRAVEERIVTVCRLQHLGAVPYDPQPVGVAANVEAAAADGPSPAEMAHQGAHILEEAGFPDEVVDLVRRARAGSLHGIAADLESAVVRVASAFDQIVGEDGRMASQALGAVTARAADPHTRLAVAALVELSATEPRLVPDAIAAGATFRDAAAGLDLVVLEPSAGDLLPFARRRP